MLFVCRPKIFHKHCLQFLLGVKMTSRETENNAYANFWGDKQRALWYVMVFSGVVNWSKLCSWGGRVSTLPIILKVRCNISPFGWGKFQPSAVIKKDFLGFKLKRGKSHTSTFSAYCCDPPSEQHTNLWFSWGSLGVLSLYRHHNMDLCLRHS